jgi:pilus assembly protein CpaC
MTAQHHLAQVSTCGSATTSEAIQADLATALPGEAIHVSRLRRRHPAHRRGLDQRAAARAAAIAERYAPKQVQCELTVRSAQQVHGRRADPRGHAHGDLADLGFNLNAQSLGGFSFSSGNGLINKRHPRRGSSASAGSIGAWNIRRQPPGARAEGRGPHLARPNLVAMSGQEASFLAGGEFPIPIPNGTQHGTTIEFQQFGVKLNVTPTVEDSTARSA